MSCKQSLYAGFSTRMPISSRALGIAALVASLTLIAGTSEAKVRKGDKVQAFTQVKDGAGKDFTLAGDKSPLVVLTFGASWCKPCSKELPALEKLAASYSSKKVSFIAVNIDSSLDKGKDFVKKAGLRRVLPVFDTSMKTVEKYEPPTMPSIYVIEAGKVIHLHEGYRDGDMAKLKKILDSRAR